MTRMTMGRTTAGSTGSTGPQTAFRQATSALAVAAVLVAGSASPARSATVFWNVDADGFWDIATNWNPGLPGTLDDVVLDVGGPTVRTITFRSQSGTVTVNAIASQENLFVTGGELIVSNAYANAQETRITGGTLRLNGVSSMATLTQTGGTLAGTGVVTVAGAATYGGSNQTGTGSTIHQGAVTLNNGASVRLDAGRTLEFRGGVTTGTSFIFNTDSSSAAGAGTLRNAAGSTFLDQSTNFSQVFSSFGGGVFENLGTYRKTGVSETRINTAFTNAGTLHIDAGTFRLFEDSTLGGTIDLAAGAVLQFSGVGTHALNGPSITGSPAGIVRVSSGTVNVTGAVALPAAQLEGGTLRIDADSTAATLTHTGGTLAGTGVVTVAGAATYGFADQTGTGSTIHTGAVTLNNGANVRLDAGRTLEFRGGVTTGTSFIFNTDSSSAAGAGTLRNAAGSTFLDQSTNFSQVFSSFGGGVFENLGTYRKTGVSETRINTAFTNAGTVRVEAGLFRMFDAVTGASGTTLTGGTWVAIGPGVIEFETGTGMTSLVTNAADLTLSGAGSRIVSASANLDLEATLTTNAAAGALRILAGRDYTATAGGGAFTNAGLLQLGGGTFTSTSLANSGTIEGFGSVAVAIANTGSTVRAIGGTLATRQITGGGTVEIRPGATLDMTAAPSASSVATLDHQGAALLLGTQNLTISTDYRNAAFGTGDAFDPRAHVSGTGLILASSATQVLSGAGLTGGATATPTLALGSRRLGDEGPVLITITNNGAETLLRGAVASAGAPGVTVSGGDSFAVAAGGGTATVEIAVTAAAAGSLAGQSLVFANNFDNVANQTVALTGGVFALANPILLADLAFGNVQQGSVQTRTITVSNEALDGVPVGFQEGLRALFGAVSDGFSGTGIIDNLVAGNSDNVTLVVTLDTSVTGLRTGTVQVLLASNGAVTSGLGLLDLDPVVFAASGSISGGVFRLAEADVQPLFVDLGNRRVGDPAPAPVALTITNTAIDDGFSESLDASVGATTGRATGSGNIALLGAESSSNAISVGIDTSVAGANGTVQILLASNGEGTSDLGITPLAPQTVTLGGGVYRLAEFDVSAPDAVIVVRVGDSASATVTIRNLAMADGFSEGLGVSATTSGDGVGFGPAEGLLAAGDQRSVTATVDTGSAGAKSGMLALDFTSDGTGTSGLVPLAIGSGSATVEAQVYAAAIADVAPTIIDFGTVRVGDTVAARSVTITNGASGDLADSLVTGAGASPAGFGASGAPGPLAAGESGDIMVTLDTSAAGSFGGDLTLGFISRNPVLSDLALGSVDVALAGTVNNLAAPVFTRFGSALGFDDELGGYVFDLGTVTQGGILSLAGFGLGNLVLGPADDLSGVVTDNLGGVIALGSAFDIGLLTAGQISDPFAILLDRSAVGTFIGQLSFAGLGTNASDPAGLDASARLFLRARVAAPDPGGVIPEPATWTMMILGFGAVGMGLRRRRRHRAMLA